MSDKYEAKGTILAVFDAVQVSERFRKREFAIEIPDGKYPQSVQFQMTGDRCDALDEYSVGDEVKVQFNLRGRKYQDKKTGDDRFFNSLDCWRIERIGEKQAGKPAGASDVQSAFGDGPDSDIPFASAGMTHEPSAIAKVLR